MEWPQGATVCRLCSHQSPAPGGLAKHLRSFHELSMYEYYKENIDQLQIRIRHSVVEVASSLEDACWVYQGRATGRMGYRQIRVAGAPVLAAHRISLWAFTGKVPDDGLYALHRCDNPGCVNPNHLRLGSHLENMAERGERGRQTQGLDHPKSCTEEQVQQARYYTTLGWPSRAVARQLDISHATVSRIVSGQSHQELPYDPAYDANFIPF